MKNLDEYIHKKFSDELKLLIYLSQDELFQRDIPVDLSKVEWEKFLELVIKHRVTSHILKHSAFLAEHLPIPVYEKLMDIRLKRSKHSLNFAIHAIRIHQQLKENNIRHCFFKGPLLSLDLYKDIGYRNFRDIDLIVKKEDAEKSKAIIEELNFDCTYPGFTFTKKQRKINYSISHHYQFTHPAQRIAVELHWNMTNPKSFFGIRTNDILSNSTDINVSNYTLPYISKLENLVYQAAHGSIHQWYRLFWLKDFSILISQSSTMELEAAYQLSKKVKLEKTFIQACKLSALLYNTNKCDFLKIKPNSRLMQIPLSSINTTDLSQKGVKGKLRFVLYRLRLKTSCRYYFELLYRLRTHLTDWEILKINDRFFFLYYLFRPFLLIYKLIFK